MNMIRFIKQAQSLDPNGLRFLLEALLTKKRQAKFGTSEYANLQAQFDIVFKLLLGK